MNELCRIQAFGLSIASELRINGIPDAFCGSAPDVQIVCTDLTPYAIPDDCYQIKQGDIRFSYDNAGLFRITNGNLIEVDPYPACAESKLGVYLMGSCMGAILHQRGFMPLHGSCVTDGKRSILITGDSGAGKSTLAAEFLKRGWKLLTDDVSAVYDVEGTPMVQSSYPSQKLWQDALDRYERPEEDIHSLYSRDDQEKFGVDVSRFFHDGACPLRMVIRLLPADAPCSISPIESMAKVDQLMRNTYRSFMIAPRDRQRHFQRCVTLSTKIPMALVIRENGKQCAETLYEMITDYLGGQDHD